MTRKGRKGYAPIVPKRCLPLVVSIGCDDVEAKHLAGLLGGFRAGRLVAYGKVNDVVQSPPRGRAALVILAGLQASEGIGRTVQLFRRRWPDAAVVVIGQAGADACEIAARVAGALYFVRPLSDGQWHALLSDAVATAPRPDVGHRVKSK